MLAVNFGPYFGRCPMVLGGVLGCFRVFSGGLEYSGAENMMILSF